MKRSIDLDNDSTNSNESTTTKRYKAITDNVIFNVILYYNNDKKKYEGEFKNSTCHGHGIYYYANELKRYEGQWCKNMPHGKGTLYHDNGVIKYKGEFTNG